ncbi:nitrate- and nitrite sensing domain-containing protein [Uniformispora flossi]|uniref:sensor histidine kinase n=1 Tax=Uniformispora flossi TaxID=3390723 RepID=UPI003C2B8656
MKLLFSIKNWRIRTRITALLLLPVVVAALLGGLRIQSSVDKTREMDVVQKAGDVINESTTLVAALEEERDQSAPLIMGGASAETNQTIQGLYKQTNDQYDRLQAAFARLDMDSLPLIKATTATIRTQMGNLGTIRKSAYQSSTPFITIQDYQKIIIQLLAINQQAPEITRDPDLIQGARALGLFGELKAYASVERAILAAYGAKPNEAFADAREGFRSIIPSDDEAVRKFKSIATESSRKMYDSAAAKGKAGDVMALLVNVNAAMNPQDKPTKGIGATPGFSADSAWALTNGKVTELMKVETVMGDELLTQADSLRDDARQEALINTVLVVAALLITIILGVIVARSLVRSLNTLRRSALEIAEQRLPETVRRLSESEPGDVDLTVEPIGVATRDEVGQVARAFDAVHAEAVRLAAEQALLRGNVNSMFVNLSRRSQSLIQRQLALISDLENREADPDQLANLFKLDHLATRMRRNGENLLVLAGEEPGRRWTRPVPLVDVLRAAASEVEQYERVELGALPTTDIAGRAVNDLVHLLAELLENSTTFSSPHTKVRVTGHILPDGRALIEIHDNGIGLTGDDLADANQRLARPPVVDVSISRRMGLFVVGRLSTRHGIRVQLRPGDGGGTTALVMLPIELIQGDRPGGAWDKNGNTGERPAVEKGWQPDALTSSQEMPALPASAAPGPQRPGPEAGRSEPPRLLPQRGGTANGAHTANGANGLSDTSAMPQANPAGQPSGYEPASMFGEGPATHDTPFPGTPFTPAADPDNPFAPVAPQAPQAPQPPRADDPRTGTAQFASPFRDGEPLPQQTQQQPAYERPQYDRTQQQPAVGDFGQAPGYGRGEYDQQAYPQPQFDQEPAEHSGNDRAAGLPRRGPETGAYPVADPQQQRASAWQTQQTPQVQPGQPGQQGQPGQDYEGLAPVAPPAQMPAYEAPQRRPEATRAQAQPTAGDALPALRQPAMPARREGEPRALHRGGEGQPAPGRPQQDAPDQRGMFRDGPGMPGQPQDGRHDAGHGLAGRPEPVRAPGVPQPVPMPQPQRELPAQEPVNALEAPAVPMTVEDERSPIFDTLESDWFHRRTGRGGRMRAAQVRSAGRGGVDEPVDEGTDELLPQRGTDPDGRLPRRSHAGPAAPAEAPGQPVPRQAAHAAPAEQAPEAVQSGWYSAGDEGFRAAEAVREPASGGTTTAGLPRRVPRANLVPGGVDGAAPAARPAMPAAPSVPGTPAGPAPVPPQSGPGLSRNPDDVRGRLTNFRRGIQQGRTAGAGGSAPQPRDQNNQEQA